MSVLLLGGLYPDEESAPFPERLCLRFFVYIQLQLGRNPAGVHRDGPDAWI